MKGIVVGILIMVICLSISACGNRIASGDNKIDVLFGENSDNEKDIYEVLTGEGHNNTFSIEIVPLEVSDFAVTDGNSNIKLDSSYKAFKTNKAEEELENNYVGEDYSGGFIYKTYMHNFVDFVLYTSNTYYNLKNRNFDEYYITQITLKNSNFKTSRGITIGSKEEYINYIYGCGNKSTVDSKTFLIYALNDMEISFEIGENQIVEGITLRIVHDG